MTASGLFSFTCPSTPCTAPARRRLAYHRKFAREGEREERIPGYPPVVYGEEENRQYGESLREKVKALGEREMAESPKARKKKGK